MEDEFFKDYIRSNASSPRCSYCRQGNRRRPIAIPFEDLVERIRDGLTAEYDDAANWLPYESAEGGYQLVEPMVTYDLLWEVGFYAGNDDLQDRILHALPD